ncbi:DUF6162 family protein [Neptuniibacter sp. QD34_54]|uniref:DUF6162 family protein n=1 Tax=Neptuniibacter sp. QD34_54 TaxID=3398208 RepID=UPI0039F6076C
MASFKTSALEEDGTVEVVRPDNGRVESYWLIGSIVIILSIANYVLQNNQAPSLAPQKHLELDVEGKAVLTALRNAADEIMFLSDDGSLPAVSELIEQELPPFADSNGTFAAYSWNLLDSVCYFGRSSKEGSREFVLKIHNDHSEIYWRQTAVNTPNCDQLTNWETASTHD